MQRRTPHLIVWPTAALAFLIALSSGILEPNTQAAPPVAGTTPAVAPDPSVVAESLQASFMRIAAEVGPSVVAISTEQIERVRQFLRVHPFFGMGQGDPFEEFFRQFYGPMPPQEFRRFGLGSGVIIDTNGHILTNEHVVANADKISITLSDGREFIGTVRGKDLRSDLAVIKIDADKLPRAPLGDSNVLKTGQWAVALGNPFGLMGGAPGMQPTAAEPTLTVGVISAMHRELPRRAADDRDYTDLIQTDAAINPGNSGGPLLNLQGEVIGINVAILSSGQGFEGIGFAIPVNKAKGILQTLIEGKRVIYGWLGVQIQDITEDVAQYYGLKDTEGVLIFQVLPDGPASKAGLREGDIIETFNGRPVRRARELIEMVSSTPAEGKVKVDILREGKPETIQVQIGERPVEGQIMAEEEEQTGDAWRGIHVGGITEEFSERLMLPPGATGVLVLEVDENSPAEAAGIHPGDIIDEINRAAVQSVEDYRRVTAQVRGDALVRTNRGYVVIKAGP